MNFRDNVLQIKHISSPTDERKLKVLYHFPRITVEALSIKEIMNKGKIGWVMLELALRYFISIDVIKKEK